MLIDIYKNTMEHKKTNFLCLEEILKKLTLILKRQNEINNFCISNKSDRQLLLQNMREVIKKIYIHKMMTPICMTCSCQNVHKTKLACYKFYR